MTIRMNDTVCPWRRFTSSNGGATAVARGLAFLGDRLLDNEAVARCVAERAASAPAERRFDVLKELATELNGAWAFMVEWPDGETVAAVDRLRTIPLSYGFTRNNDFVVANEVDDLKDCRATTELDEEATYEFLLAGYTIGSHTLRPGIRQLRTGEILHWKDRRLDVSHYYWYLRSGWSTAGKEQLMDQLGEIMDCVFSRLVKQLADRRIFVSLSGGLDSRLVLAMLIRHGHPDITAFTYGFSTEKNTIISRKVAAAAGVPWEFISYDEGDWQTLTASREMRDFWRFAGQDSTIPHIMDYLALHKLRKKDQRLEPVFVSGMAGDMIAGAWVPDHFTDNEGPLEIEKVVRWTYYRKFNLWPSQRRVKRDILQRMRKYFDDVPFTGVHNSAAAFDLFEMDNRLAKYICNSTRTLDHHGFRWHLPLCTNELMDFYLTVPTELREVKRLFALWMRDRAFVGPLARLAEIPPAGDGCYVWYNKPRDIRHSLLQIGWRHTRNILKWSVLSRIAQWRIVSGFVQQGYQPLRFSEWFVSGELAAKTTTVGDLLDSRDGTFDRLPPAVAAYVSKYRHFPVCLVPPSSLLGLAYLTELKRSGETWTANA